jgi:hypothetical protein
LLIFIFNSKIVRFFKAYSITIISLGEDTKLFKDKKVSPGCTPWYLPDFISIEADKRGL